MDVWSVMLNFFRAVKRSFSRSTSNIDHRRPTRERINVNKNWTNTSPLTSRSRFTYLRPLERAPRACPIAVHIANVRTTATAKSPWKSAIWNQDAATVSIAPHDWSRRYCAAGRRQWRLRAAATGDLTASGYCSFQVTKCEMLVRK